MSDYLRICGSQHGITATAGGTLSVRFCVRNFFLQKHVSMILGQKKWPGMEGMLILGGSVLSRSSLREPCRSGDPNPLFLLQNVVATQIFVCCRYGQVRGKVACIFHQFFIGEKYIRQFSNFRKRRMHLQSEKCIFRGENIFCDVFHRWKCISSCWKVLFLCACSTQLQNCGGSLCGSATRGIVFKLVRTYRSRCGRWREEEEGSAMHGRRAETNFCLRSHLPPLGECPFFL